MYAVSSLPIRARATRRGGARSPLPTTCQSAPRYRPRLLLPPRVGCARGVGWGSASVWAVRHREGKTELCAPDAARRRWLACRVVVLVNGGFVRTRRPEAWLGRCACSTARVVCTPPLRGPLVSCRVVVSVRMWITRVRFYTPQCSTRLGYQFSIPWRVHVGVTSPIRNPQIDKSKVFVTPPSQLLPPPHSHAGDRHWSRGKNGNTSAAYNQASHPNRNCPLCCQV